MMYITLNYLTMISTRAAGVTQLVESTVMVDGDILSVYHSLE